jgi:DNA polymerase (family X)
MPAAVLGVSTIRLRVAIANVELDMPQQSWRSQKVRRPRHEIEPCISRLAEELSERNPGALEFHFGGSWRRGAPVIGDIDILIVTETGLLSADLLSEGVELPGCVTYQRSGPKIALGSMPTPDGGELHVDIWSCPPRERGAQLLFCTGPMQLNLYQRRLAKRHGMALSQIGLLDAVTKQQLDDGTEEDIYRLLNLRWLSPADRQRWASR